MSRATALVYILYGLVAVALAIAPTVFAHYIAVQSALSQAAQVYAHEPSCRRTAQLPDPRVPIAASALTGSPCRLTGAMIVDTSYSGGPGGRSYAL
ncbi:MAG TPA: hypothetical protein VKT51_02345, partial [Candidatus Eremiobacteraceae bacterium]|nr:hypothetical protein [Candidatus Eremiobacteraceae bacterium]